jgi:hypothetical protein
LRQPRSMRSRPATVQRYVCIHISESVELERNVEAMLACKKAATNRSLTIRTPKTAGLRLV